MKLEKRLYDEKEVSELLGFTRQTMNNMRRQKRIEFYRLNARTIKYSAEQINNYLNKSLVRTE
jgi:hypothetical protein